MNDARSRSRWSSIGRRVHAPRSTLISLKTSFIKARPPIRVSSSSLPSDDGKNRSKVACPGVAEAHREIAPAAPSPLWRIVLPILWYARRRRRPRSQKLLARLQQLRLIARSRCRSRSAGYSSRSIASSRPRAEGCKQSSEYLVVCT